MLHNAKATVLTIAILCAAGCAKSDYRVGHQFGKKWMPIDDRRIAKVSEAVSPKILPATYFAAAQLFEHQGSVERAITQYKRTIGAKHDHVEARHRLGRLLGKIGQHLKAVAMLQSAVELAPENASLHNDLGFELVYLKEWDLAEFSFRKAIELRPAFPRAYINLGMTLCRLDRHDEALESFQAVLPEADAYYNLGLMFRGQARYAEALKAFRTASTLDPELTAAHNQVAMLTEKTSQRTTKEESVPTGDNASNEATVIVLKPRSSGVKATESAKTDEKVFVAVPMPTQPKSEVVASKTPRQAPQPNPESGTPHDQQAVQTERTEEKLATVETEQATKDMNAEAVVIAPAPEPNFVTVPESVETEAGKDKDTAPRPELTAKMDSLGSNRTNITEDTTPMDIEMVVTEAANERQKETAAQPAITPTSGFTTSEENILLSDSVTRPVESPVDSGQRLTLLPDDFPKVDDNPCLEEFLEADLDMLPVAEGQSLVKDEFLAEEPMADVAVVTAKPTEKPIQKQVQVVVITDTPERTPKRIKREFFLTQRKPNHQKRIFNVGAVKHPAERSARQSASSMNAPLDQEAMDGPVIASTLEQGIPPAMMCPAEALCYADMLPATAPWPAEYSTELESIFMESYAVPVSFVGQGKNPAMATERRIRIRELTDRLAVIRDEIECLTDREDDREARARARMLEIDQSPMPLPRMAVAAANTETLAPVARARKSAEVSSPTVNRMHDVVAGSMDKPINTMTPEVAELARNEFAGLSHGIFGSRLRPMRLIDRQATLKQLAEQLNHVRQEISCLEDVANDEHYFRNLPRVTVASDSEPEPAPIIMDQRRSDVGIENVEGPPQQEFATVDFVDHPVLAWLGAIPSSIAAEVRTSRTSRNSTAVQAKKPANATEDPSSTARLTLKILDRAMGDSNAPKRSVMEKPVVANVVLSKPTAEFRWLRELFDALETEASCRSGSPARAYEVQRVSHQEATGDLPPEISFDVLMDIVKMRVNMDLGNGSAVKPPTNNK